MPKTYIPFVQSSYQNWTDLGSFGGLDKGFYGNDKQQWLSSLSDYQRVRVYEDEIEGNI